MGIKWIIIAILLVCVIALILYLIFQNEKDKEEVISSLNEPKIEDDPKKDESEEN